MALVDRSCVPCQGGVPPLGPGDLARLQPEVPAWDVAHGRRLVREFRFRDFANALAFVDRVGALAEEQGHHPDLYLAYGKVRVELWTHAIDGLTESDFVLAARTDRLWDSAAGRTF